jgi:hypothetical protein
VRLTSGELDDYVVDLAELAERYGITLNVSDGPSLAVETEPDGAQRFNLSGFLPDGRQPPRSIVQIAEAWLPDAAGGYERSEYRYELIDHERGYRRAFHWHDESYFEHRFGVVVHEHCESPMGSAPCPHYFGAPVRDGYRAIELLISIWVGDPPHCLDLPYLEPI